MFAGFRTHLRSVGSGTWAAEIRALTCQLVVPPTTERHLGTPCRFRAIELDRFYRS